MNTLNKPRGTQDFLAQKAKLYREIVAKLDEVAINYGCDPIQVPMYEESRLFKRGVGDGTDIVTKETFDLAGKGDHDYSLRPEFTAGIMRAVIENKLYASPDLPLKFFYSGSIFRYERPQQGRYREPHQWGIEFLDSTLDDSTVAEAILLMIDGLKALDIAPILHLNNLGGEESRVKYKAALIDYFAPHKADLCADCQKRLSVNPLRLLDCKVEDDRALVKDAPRISDYLVAEDQLSFARLLAILDECAVSYTIDERLVRGLDYYTGPVFEVYEDQHRDLGALGGGGRYDKLMETLGGPSFTGIGFSFGLDRLMLTKGEGLSSWGPKVMIVVEKSDEVALSKVKHDLRLAGISVFSPTAGKKLNGALKIADRLKIRFAIFQNENGYQLKNLESRQQTTVDIADTGALIKALSLE